MTKDSQNRQRPDPTWLIRVGLGLGVLALLLLIAVYFARMNVSAAEQKASADFASHMDAAQARSDRHQAEADSARARQM